ncbi:MAG: hypothetical protein M1527_00010 [Gammaproteobacteria bacterium]|nr:hypothetical protein [Gammaproteobacteria bacterium]
MILTSRDGQCSSGAMLSTVYSPRERTLRALKAWAICWMLALLSLPIIGLHWFLVPGFSVAGVVLGVQRYRMREASRELNGRCVLCGKEFSLALEPNERAPLWKYCPHCQAALCVEAA